MHSLKLHEPMARQVKRMNSAQSALADAQPTEAFPRWRTRGDATFITGVDEDVLQSWVAAGLVRSDRSLARRLGQHYLLVLREDLETAAHVEATIEPAPAPDIAPVFL